MSAHAKWLSRPQFENLLELILSDGYRLIGPTVDEAAIIYDDIEGARDLPIGWTDEQGPGHYRIVPRQDDAYFGYVVGPHSWKQQLFAPQETLVNIRRTKDAVEWTPSTPEVRPTAFLGVRACELAAIVIQDKVFLGGPHVEARYQIRREQCLIIAVNCVEAGELCFCDSMGTGPKVGPGYDICLTEVAGGFVVEAETDAGTTLLGRVGASLASPPQLEAVEGGIEHCRNTMGRHLDTKDLPGLLFGNLDHSRWDEVADRCLACGNCTQVCPTCFCFNTSDASLLSNDVASRERTWDSCFTQDHSAIHGAQFRPAVADQYRQWLTHKVGSWVSQFGTSGCVGCGRCIAWCPVGIDITEELAAIRAQAPNPAVSMPVAKHGSPEPGDAMLPRPARVREVRIETDDTVTLVLDRATGSRELNGQFNMVSLPGIGDLPLSVSGGDNATVEHTVRGVGEATRALCAVRPGDTVGLRGPFGSGWPMEDARHHPVVIVAGGIGLAPLRGVMLEMVANPKLYPEVVLLYGTRTPQDILYDTELLDWDTKNHCDVSVTVDRADGGWMGNVGYVTSLMRRKPLLANARYFICGPEVMMSQVLRLLDEAGVPEAHSYLSMERNMKCAAGFCGRCQYGPYFVCKDGPVFRFDKISSLFGQRGF